MTEYLKNRIRELEEYQPALTKRPDFDSFWRRTIEWSDSVPLEPVLTEAGYPSPYIKAYDLSYRGCDQTEIKGWFLLPRFTGSEKLPCMVCYHGFGGSRELPQNYAPYLLMGIAVVAVECRLQGGDTGSLAGYPGGLVTNVNSMGVLDKETYYYRNVYMDCMRAVDFALMREEVDSSRIIVQGGSQGGALCLAVAALHENIALALADVPSNSNIEARIEGAYGSFSCLTDYIRRFPERMEQVYETVSYFDVMNLADRITCPVLASVCLKDDVCPAKCFYAAANRITSEKEICVYPFNGHDSGGYAHAKRKLEYLKEHQMIG